jgi:hypothetical protein
MSGIINYFHGESGTVADRCWSVSGQSLALQIQLIGDPHRQRAWDYGGDIGIDPDIVPGNSVVYLRLEDTTGIWVRSAVQSAAELHEAIDRVLENRRYIAKWQSAKSAEDYGRVAREIYEASGDPLRVISTEAGEASLAVLSAGWAILTLGEGFSERPAAFAGFFLSHAAEDSLLARRVFEDMTSDANAAVWFDLSRPVEEVPKDDATIAAWLRKSIHAVNGFVVLWTEHAADSEWVKRELFWARELRRRRADFHVILLRLRDVDVPKELHTDCLVIDCNDIWWSNGLNEELYAVIFRRPPRREWFAKLPPGAPASKGTTIGYDDFASDSGTAVRFDWGATYEFPSGSLRNDVQWKLEYRRRDGRHVQVAGGGANQTADLGIKPGDRIGFFKVRWRHGSHFLHGPDLWMRSGDFAITSDSVLDEYFGKRAELQRSPREEP